MKKFLLFGIVFFGAVQILSAQPNAWINELHYDNTGGDVGEFVEVVIENAGSYTLSDFEVYLYNGNGGASYSNKSLDEFTPGISSDGFTIYYVLWSGIQNGGPDGLSLSYQTTLITGQFLSYEGTFTAVGGPADGVLSTDMGVSEPGSTPVGQSLQLAGSGTAYDAFVWQAPAAETPGDLNNGQLFGGVVPNDISYAYAISETAMDVVHMLSVTSVNASDYTLTGSANITFSSATIDGTNDQIVHLTGASSNMTGDVTLDNITDAVTGSDDDFYAGILPINFVNTTNPGGTMDNDYLATFTGIISANDAFNNVWMSDNSTAYHGALVFSSDFDNLVDVGDEVLITASRDIYNDLTELVSPVLLNTISTGNDPYGPEVIDGSQIEETISTDTDPGEKWEGQLVKIEDFTVDSYTDYDYRCSWSNGSTTYYFHIGDNVNYHFGAITLNVGASYGSITGVVDWASGGPYYRINPREQADIEDGPAAARIVGTMNDWSTTDPDWVCSPNANGVYELTKSLDGFNEYKVLEGDDWSAPAYPGSNQPIDLTEPTDITWKVNITDDLVTHTNPVVAGNFFEAMGEGSNWDPTNLAGELTDPDGDDIFTAVLMVPGGSWECKVTLNNNWDQSTGGNTPFSSSGLEATTFSYDMATNTTTVSGPPPEFATITFIVDETLTMSAEDFYLKGTWTDQGFYDPGWGGGAEHSEFFDDGTHGDAVAGDHIWTTQQDLAVDGGSNSWEWGFNNSNHGWAAGNFQFTVPDTEPQTLSYDITTLLADLIFTEISYNPPESGTDSLEYLELYNRGTEAVDLPEMFIGAGVVFTFPYTDETLDPGSFVVVAVNSDAMLNFFGVTTYQWFSGGLSNGGETVTINDRFGRVVNSVSYDDSPPWPTEPDGDGPSLVFCEPTLDNTIPDFWSASIDYVGENANGDAIFGSPGTGCIYNVPEMLITEIMYHPPNEDIDNLEFIEIRNIGGQTINLAGYQITNAIQHTFGSINLVPGEYVIVAKDADAFLTTFGSFAIQWDEGDLSNDGETIELRDDFGNIINQVPYDNESPWPTEPDGEGPSLTFCYQDFNNEVPDYWSASTEFAAVNTQGDDIYATPYAACDLPDVNLVITEIMYNPPESGTDSLEYIEIYNNSEDNINMESFYFSKGVEFMFPDFTLNSHDYVLVAVSSDAMMNTFGKEAFQWTSGGLSNGGEEIEVRDWLDDVVDYVYYDDQLPWDTLADGYGPSLTLCDPDSDNTLAENWIASAEYAAVNAAGDSIFGTPGSGCGETAPIVDFEADNPAIEEGMTINFTDLSTGDPTSWLWTFEGGTPGTSTAQNPQNILYDAPGTYDVMLEASNDFGDGQLVKIDYITVYEQGTFPVADFEASATSVVAGGLVDFLDMSTGDPNSWSWTFDGGTPSTSTDANPANIKYSVPGIYDVTLTAANAFGEDTETKVGYITVGDTAYYDIVITEIMYNGPEAGADTIEFIELYNNDVVTIDMEGYYFSEGVDFEFPAVSFMPGEYLLIAISEQAMMNTFGVEAFEWTDGGLNNGGEDIELKDAFGITQDYVEYDDVAPWPTEPDGQGPSLTLCNPNDDNNVGENWSASTEFANVNADGDTIWASPGAGCSSIPPIADFYTNETVITVGSVIDFYDVSLGDPDTWEWTFEGGDPASSTSENPTGILYSEPGTYDVTLKVTNEFGDNTIVKEDYISVGYVPVADFEASNTTIVVGETTSFTDLSTHNPVTWNWTFEGGEPLISTEQNPDVTFLFAGDFDVILKVTNAFGESTEIKTEYIHVAVGIGENQLSNIISVYPNPNTGLFNIETGGLDIEYEIYSIIGELVLKNKTNNPVEEINLTDHGKGLYFIRIREINGTTILTKKVVVK